MGSEVGMATPEKTTLRAIQSPDKLEASQQIFRFLDLCAELRNKIYEKACEAKTAHVSDRGKGRVWGVHPLGGVNHQVRKEFMPVFYHRSPTLTVEVYDFNFKHVVTFLNRLSDAEFHALCIRPKKSLTFEMHLANVPPWVSDAPETSLPMGDGDADKLETWLKRLQNPAKRGGQLVMRHKIYGALGGFHWWYFALQQLEEKFKGERVQVELSEMKLSLRRSIAGLFN